MTQLFADYWPPLYAFLRRRGFTPQDAQDLVQGFFAHLSATGAYTSVDRAKGHFRSFLLASLRHYLADDHDRRHAAKRGGGQAPVPIEPGWDQVETRWMETSPAESSLTEELAFERQWAFAVVGRALDTLTADFADGGKRERAFLVLKPFLTGGALLPDRAGAAARLGTTEEGLHKELFRLRGRYRECLRQEVRRTVPPGADLEVEMAYLCRVLLAAG